MSRPFGHADSIVQLLRAHDGRAPVEKKAYKGAWWDDERNKRGESPWRYGEKPYEVIRVPKGTYDYQRFEGEEQVPETDEYSGGIISLGLHHGLLRREGDEIVLNEDMAEEFEAFWEAEKQRRRDEQAAYELAREFEIN